MNATAGWFETSKKGLADIARRRGLGWIITELISNGWDEQSTCVDVQLTAHEGKPLVTIVVTDDNPEGFKDLRDAWTLFAPSKKKGDAEKRGRFNLGEKLVLSVCDSAVIKTTTGAVLFDHRGRHMRPSWRTERGSVFEGDIRMTRAELADVMRSTYSLIVPIPTTINGVTYKPGDRKPVASFSAKLLTELSDDTGEIKRTTRKTTLALYKPLLGEVGSIYEMGIPVCETGDAFHVDIGQKVPLNMERDNVTPGYLREIRGLALQHAHGSLSAEEKHRPWVTEALAHPAVDKSTVNAVLDVRFGEKRVAADLSDREGEDIAKSKGYTIVHGGSLPGDVWEKVKEHGLILPAGQVTPSPKPFHPDGEELKLASWDEGDEVRLGLKLYQMMALRLLGWRDMPIRLANDRGWEFRACFGKTSGLTLNLAKLGKKHFDSIEEISRLAIHEFAHYYESNHLAEGFHEACCKLGAKWAAWLAEFGGFTWAAVEEDGT